MNEYYAKNPQTLGNSALAKLHDLARSVQAGAYARNMIDINRAEAAQYFRDRNMTDGGGGAKPAVGNANNAVQGKAANNIPDLRSPLETPEDTKNINIIRDQAKNLRKLIYDDKGHYLKNPQITDLQALKIILTKSAEMANNDPDKFILYTNETLMGNSITEFHAIPGGIVRSKRNIINFGDLGWDKHYKDNSFNQTRHLWFYVLVSYRHPDVANYLNKIHETIDPSSQGKSMEDYSAGKIGIMIGVELKEKIINPIQLSRDIDRILGTDTFYDKEWEDQFFKPPSSQNNKR